MAKIKHEMEPCSDRLFPLGKGLPLCSYLIVKKGLLATAKLQDFPMCDPKKCPKNAIKSNRETKECL